MLPQQSLDHFLGPWLIHHKTMNQIHSMVEPHLDAYIEARLADDAGEDDPGREGIEPVVIDGIAVIDVEGVLTKHAHSLMALTGGTSTVEARRAIREVWSMARRGEVHGMMVRVDSPGGSAMGVADLAADIRATREKIGIPVHTYAEDMAASGGYWIFSQGTRRSTNSTGHLGSIGAFAYIEDRSKMAQEEGRRGIVISTGTYKGAFVGDAPVKDEHIKDFRRELFELLDVFVADISAGTGMSVEDVRDLADGKVHVGIAAQRLGLADEVITFDEALENLKEVAMAKTTATTSGATGVEGVEMVSLKQEELDAKLESSRDAGAASERERFAALKNAFGSHPQFVMDQFDKGHDVAAAAPEYSSMVNEELKKARAQVSEKSTTSKTSDGNGPSGEEGTEPVSTVTSDETSGVADAEIDYDNADDPDEAAKIAEQEWAKNVNDCRDRFSSKSNYVTVRKAELTGLHRTSARS